MIPEHELLASVGRKNLTDLANKYNVTYNNVYYRRKKLIQPTKRYEEWPVPHYTAPLPEINGIFDDKTFARLAGYSKQ